MGAARTARRCCDATIALLTRAVRHCGAVPELADLLHRLQLWSPAAVIIAKSENETVRRLNQADTSLDIGCRKCLKPVGVNASLRCPACTRAVSSCALWYAPPMLAARRATTAIPSV